MSALELGVPSVRGFVIAAAMVAGAALFAFVAQPGLMGGGGSLLGSWPLAIGAAVALLILSAGLIRAARHGDGPDEGDTRTPAWYWSRLELGIGVVSVLLIGLLGWFAPRPFSGDRAITLGPFLLPSWTSVPIAALVGAVAGLIWMIRILRGPRDEPPPWRYRKR
jgi:hypothetical protein